MAIARLTIDLVAQLAEMQKGMDRGVAIATGAVGRIESKLNGLASVAKGVGAAIGGALAVGGLTQLFRSTVDGIDKLNDLADATGSTVGNLSALEDAARRTSTGVDVVGDALVKLNKTLAEAKPGSEQAAVLQSIGLSAAQLRQLDPAEALLKVAQALSRFSDDGSKARVVQELFGKSIREVAPLLKDLVEQGQLNATVTNEQAAEAERFNHQLAAAKKNSEDLARTVASELLPMLNQLFERGKKEGLFSALFTPSETQRQIEQAQSLSRSITAVGDALARATANANNADLPGAVRAKWAADAEALRKQLERFQSEALKVSDKLKGVGVGAVVKSQRDLLRALEAESAVKPSLPGIQDPALTNRFEEFVQRLREAQLATQDLSEVERTRMALTRPELQGLTDDQRKYLLVLAAINDEMRGRVEVFEDARDAQVRLAKAATLPRPNGEALDRAFRTVRSPDEAGSRAVITNVEALSAQSRAAQIRELSAAMVSVREQMAAGGGSATAYREALDILGERMRALEDNAQDLNEKLGQGSEEAKAAAGQLQEAFGASLLSAMEGNARKIDRIWGDLVRRLVAQAASAKLMEQLFGKNFSGRGELGGWIGRLVGAFGGGGGSAGGGGVTNGIGEVIKNGAGTGSKLSGNTSSKSQASAQGGVVQHIYVQGDVGTKARRAMLGVAAQIQARNQRAAAF
jgi:hypothetical protein